GRGRRKAVALKNPLLFSLQSGNIGPREGAGRRPRCAWDEAFSDLQPDATKEFARETRRAMMGRQADGLLNTLLRTAATALIGAAASLSWFIGARAENAPLVIAKQGY